MSHRTPIAAGRGEPRRSPGPRCIDTDRRTPAFLLPLINASTAGSLDPATPTFSPAPIFVRMPEEYLAFRSPPTPATVEEAREARGRDSECARARPILR